MTTGTIGSYATLSAASFTGTSRYKNWTGADGKYTTFAGASALKFNNYDLEYWYRARASAHFNVIYGYKYMQYHPDIGDGNPAYWSIEQTTFPGAISANPGLESVQSWDPNDELKLLSKLINKTKEHDFNLGVSLAQTRQFTRMVDSNLQKLGRAALALKRGRFQDAARQLGARPRSTRLKTSDISGRWLELQYGWLPTIKDTYEAAKAFEVISNGPKTVTVHATNKKKVISEGSQQPSSYTAKYKEELKKTIQFQMTEEIGFERQLGLMDPLSVAWELIPWSFVVDWFIPIGTYLDVLNQISSLHGRFLTTQRRTAIGYSDFRWTDVGTIDFTPKIIGVASVPTEVKMSKTLVRRFSTSLPPTVPLPNLRWKGAVEGRRVWNAISLAHQRFG